MRLSIVLLLAAVGCGEDEPAADPYKCMAAGGEACFELPTAKVGAADPMSGAEVTPSLDCAAYEITTSTMPITLSGLTVKATNAETIVPAVRVEVFSDLTLATQIGDITSDDGVDNPDLIGQYSLTIDAMPSLAFARTTKLGNLPLHFLYQRMDIATSPHVINMETATRADVAGLLELVGDQFLPGKSQVAAQAIDCAGNRLVNVVANVAPSTGANGTRLFEPGVRTYYAVAGNTPLLERRTVRMQTTTSGGFAASNLSPGRHFVQIWGFVTDADLAKGSSGLKLLGEKEVVVSTTEIGIILPVHGRLSAGS